MYIYFDVSVGLWSRSYAFPHRLYYWLQSVPSALASWESGGAKEAGEESHFILNKVFSFGSFY